MSPRRPADAARGAAAGAGIGTAGSAAGADVAAPGAPAGPSRVEGPDAGSGLAALATDGPRDEVDGIVAAWQHERPDLDVEPLQVMSRLDRLAGVLATRRAEIFARHELRRHEFDVLAALRRAGEPFQVTAGELAARTYVTSGTMTSRLDGLSARGLVRRVPDRVDGRLVRVALTPSGREIVDGAFGALLAAERELLAPLPPEALGPLAATLRVLLARAETH